MRRFVVTLISLALVAPWAATPTALAAGAADRPTVIARGLVSPLSLDVTPKGAVWFSQNFAGLLMRARPGKKARPVYAHPRGAEVGAVSVHRGVAAFAITTRSGKAFLMERSKQGDISRVANLSRFETAQNPDAESTYGPADVDQECVDQLKRRFRPYTGIVESHPYASVALGGTRFVADAAGNTILSVADDGSVDSVAVLPPMPTTITAEAAEQNGLPDCMIGEDFYFEPVPTGVEAGPDGMLYVTTLPGGPEDPALGARAAVHRIDPATGDLTTVAGGLLTATGLAVADNGDIYVAELFAGRISRIPAGESAAEPWHRASLPGDVAWQNGRLWATRKVLTGLSGAPGDRPRGQVVRFPG